MQVTQWLATYGYGAVFLGVAIESTGIPFPGETMLLVAAIAAGTTHALAIPLVIVAAAGGAMLGDNLGYWIGATGGVRLLQRNPRFVRWAERKLKLGLALFQQHGGKVVFFGRFVTVLRVWAALLAGMFHLRWSRFSLFNASGALAWATGYGLGGYFLGDNVHRLTGPLGWGLLGVGGCLTIGLFFFWRRQERAWEEQAVRAFPGPLDQYLGPGNRRHARSDSRSAQGWEKRVTQLLVVSAQHEDQLPTLRLPSLTPTPLLGNDQQETPPVPAPLRPIHLERLPLWKERATEEQRMM